MKKITEFSIEQFEKLKKERIKDDKARDKDRKIIRFFNRLILIEMTVGLVIMVIIYLFYWNKLK